MQRTCYCRALYHGIILSTLNIFCFVQMFHSSDKILTLGRNQYQAMNLPCSGKTAFSSVRSYCVVPSNARIEKLEKWMSPSVCCPKLFWLMKPVQPTLHLPLSDSASQIASFFTAAWCPPYQRMPNALSAGRPILPQNPMLIRAGVSCCTGCAVRN